MRAATADSSRRSAHTVGSADMTLDWTVAAGAVYCEYDVDLGMTEYKCLQSTCSSDKITQWDVQVEDGCF